jgi:TIR domain/NACHT domain
VLALANRLRKDGIDAMLDQYAPAPPQGWPRWMERELQAGDFVLLVCTETYLRRIEGREEPGKGRGVVWEANLIYNLIYPAESEVQRFVPLLIADGQPASIPLPLRGLTHYRVDTDRGSENLYRHLTNQPGTPIPPVGQRRSLPPKEPQSYPSSPAAKSDPKPPSSLEQRHRRQLIKQVRLDWIEGVLNQSLYKVARLELDLTNKTDAVEQPLNAVVQVPDRSPTPIQLGTRISQVFDEQAGALLILGAPGTGKTTFLLELAQDLLDRAEQDESQPIPVVFPLSSWAAKRQSLAQWLTKELNQRSYVPKKVARQWGKAEQILPLLDGLDEVAAQHRGACVDTIN